MVHSKLGYEALLAILLGIVVGLFFGPMTDVLKPIGDIFVLTLQIVVLPYIPSLLMHGLGSLSPDLALKLFKRGWFILILIWIFVLIVCYIVKTIIPSPLQNPALGFSLEQSAASTQPLSLIVPGNKFYDIFNNIVPIITIFSLIFGLAIMHLKNKDPLLSLLERINSSLDRVIKWISYVAPIGIFAHVAYVMGTVNFSDLAKLQLYVVLVIFTTLFLSIWAFPAIVSCLTSIPYKELFQEYKIVSFLPFATGIPTLALPYINNSMRRLAERKNLELANFRNTSQTIIPIGFGFAQVGNFLPLLFLFFMAFFYRHPLSTSQTIALPFLVTIFSLGTPQFTFIALPFLLRTLSLPAEGFNLFAEISAITLNFQVLLSTVSMLSFMYLVILRFYGLLQINWKRLFFHAASMLVVLLGFAIIGKRVFSAPDNYSDLYYSLKLEIENPPAVVIYKERPPSLPGPFENPMARILKRQAIRVGYSILDIPFSYLNKWGELVGYDIAYAYELAKDLGVKLELVPINYNTMIEDVNAGYCDIVMSAIIVDEKRILGLDFTNVYMEQLNALIIPHAKTPLYKDLSTVQKMHNLKIGAIGAYEEIAKEYFPNSIVVPSGFDSLLNGTVDARLCSEIQGYIWCLAHTHYKTLAYNGLLGKKFFAYPTKLGADQMVQFINEWMQLKQEQGFELQQRQHWFLGKSFTPESKRWSFIRDVLHWVH